jgi:hypothetical protein
MWSSKPTGFGRQEGLTNETTLSGCPSERKKSDARASGNLKASCVSRNWVIFGHTQRWYEVREQHTASPGCDMRMFKDVQGMQRYEEMG